MTWGICCRGRVRLDLYALLRHGLYSWGSPKRAIHLFALGAVCLAGGGWGALLTKSVGTVALRCTAA